jgi:transposase
VVTTVNTAASAEAAPVATHLDVLMQRIAVIQGVGITIATASVARVPSIHLFKPGRSFASRLGLTCREYSSGQTRRLSRITKQGDRYLRTMLFRRAARRKSEVV